MSDNNFQEIRNSHDYQCLCSHNYESEIANSKISIIQGIILGLKNFAEERETRADRNQLIEKDISMTDIVCPRCSMTNVLNSRFCRNCGTPLISEKTDCMTIEDIFGRYADTFGGFYNSKYEPSHNAENVRLFESKIHIIDEISNYPQKLEDTLLNISPNIQWGVTSLKEQPSSYKNGKISYIDTSYSGVRIGQHNDYKTCNFISIKTRDFSTLPIVFQPWDASYSVKEWIEILKKGGIICKEPEISHHIWNSYFIDFNTVNNLFHVSIPLYAKSPNEKNALPEFLSISIYYNLASKASFFDKLRNQFL